MHRLTAADFQETQGHTLPMVHEPEPPYVPTKRERVINGVYWSAGWALLAWLAVLCMTVAGCGGGDPDEPEVVSCKEWDRIAPPPGKALDNCNPRSAT